MSAPAPLSYSLRTGQSDETILYLHGFLGDREDWTDVITRLGARWTHLTVDLPGHGRTAPMLQAELTDNDFTMPGCAALLVRLLDDLHIERCRLVGYSMGGRLGLYLLIHHAERFTGTLIESASPGVADEPERRVRSKHDDALAAQLESGPLDRFLDFWYRQPLFATLDRKSERFSSMIARRLGSHPAGLARSLRLMGTGVQPSLWSDLGRIAVPLTFVAGALDPKFTDIATRVAPLCPDAKTAIIPGAGHNVHFERPAEYTDVLRESLGSMRSI